MHKETIQCRGRRVHQRFFSNWLEFVKLSEMVHRYSEGMTYNELRCSSLEPGQRDWSGTSSLHEAIDLAYNGWPEGRARLESLREKLSIEQLLPTSQRIEEVRDVFGDEPNVDLFLSGEPEHMITLEEKVLREGGKLIRLCVNRSAASSVSSERITRRGLALLMAIETLVTLGYSLEFSIYQSVKSDRDSYYDIMIPVLHAGDPISLDSFAFLLMHPAVLRRLIFAAEETESRDLRTEFGFDSSYYGYPRDPLIKPECDLFMDWGDGLLDEDNEVVPFALSILKRVGIDTSRAA